MKGNLSEREELVLGGKCGFDLVYVDIDDGLVSIGDGGGEGSNHSTISHRSAVDLHKWLGQMIEQGKIKGCYG